MSARETEATVELDEAQFAFGDDSLPIVVLPEHLDVEREFAGKLEPVLSLAAIEAELENELTLEREGWRSLFSMPRVCRYAAAAATALLALLLVVGWSYYRLPLVLRPFHFFHALLRPSGALGLSLGVLGALFLVASLSYVVRKSLVSWRLGPLQAWMGFHILTGLLGPAIALFHAGFVPTSALGLLALVAALVVVASGIVGRYVAVYFPRSLGGREFKFEEVRGRLIVYRKKLEELGVDPGLLRVDSPKPMPRAPWFIPSLARVVRGDWESRREYRRLRDLIRSRREFQVEMELILFLIRRLCWERQWLVRYGEFRRLVGTWRFLHRWLAVVLLVAVAFHVVVGAKFGGLWIFGGRR